MTLRILINRLPEASFVAVDRAEAGLERARALAPDRVTAERRDVVGDGPPNLAGCDVVINLAGPFYGGSDAIARAALGAGVAYLDICDDAEGARAILDLDEEARAAGVPLITGAGNSPGMSNVLGMKLLADFPECDGVRVVWVVRDADPGGLAPLRHMLHMAVSPCPVWRDGKLADTPGFVPSTRRDLRPARPGRRDRGFRHRAPGAAHDGPRVPRAPATSRCRARCYRTGPTTPSACSAGSGSATPT